MSFASKLESVKLYTYINSRHLPWDTISNLNELALCSSLLKTINFLITQTLQKKQVKYCFLLLIIILQVQHFNIVSYSNADDKISFPVDGSVSVSLPATLNDGSGKFSVARVSATTSFKSELFTVKISARRDMYSWFNKSNLPFGNRRSSPWDALNRLGIGIRHSGVIDDKWGYFASVDTSASFEKELDGSLGLSATAGAIWKPTQEWSFRLGAGVVWHLVRSYPVPVVGVTYRSSAIEGLNAALGFPYSHIGYQINEWLGIRLTGEMDYGLYRLASDSSVRSKGYVELIGYSTGLWMEMTPLEKLNIQLGCAWDFQGTVALYRENGEGQKQYSRSGTPRFGANLKYEF